MQGQCCIHSFDPDNEARCIALPQVCLRSCRYLGSIRVILSIHCNFFFLKPNYKQVPQFNFPSKGKYVQYLLLFSSSLGGKKKPSHSGPLAMYRIKYLNLEDTGCRQEKRSTTELLLLLIALCVASRGLGRRTSLRFFSLTSLGQSPWGGNVSPFTTW